MGERISPPAPKLNALGTIPATIAIVVMMIGRIRDSHALVLRPAKPGEAHAAGACSA